jgi:hypothetical protein
MKWTPAILAIVGLMMFAAPAEGQRNIDWGVRGGVWFDETDAFVGVEAITPLTDKIFFNPNVEVIFRDQDEDIAINADAHYDFDAGTDRFIWAGAGVAALLGDDDDFGVNVIGGYGVDLGSVIPYGQFKVFFADDAEASFGVGIRF